MSEDEAALEGVRGEGHVGARARAVEVEDEIVGVGGGEDQGGSFYREDDGGLEQAGDFLEVGGAQRRGDRGLDGGEADDDDGFGVVEGGGRVEAEVESFAVREGDGWDVLILGGVEATHEADKIDDGADVSTVDARASHLGIAGLVDEVGAGSVGEGFSDGLAVAVVEEGLVAGLSEAVGLGVEGLLEAVAVGFEVESAGQEVGVLGESFGVVGWNAVDVGEVDLDSGLLEAGFDEVLRGADEDAGAAADGGAEGGEVAAGFRGEEEDDLLGLGGYGDGDAFFTNVFVPSLDLGEPVVRGRVGGASEEGGYEKIVDGLGGREVWVQPELVSGQEVGDLGDGQGFSVAGDVDVDAGASEVEARGGVGVEGGAGEEEGS
jgi:hypothetical protein